METSIDPMEVVPMEDTIEALLDYLIVPLLPLRESVDETPSDQKQETIAKQMHAVAILYNYYHRKQFPKLEFLGFESFCKVCCIAKPGLLSYLRYLHKCEEDSENLNDQFSIMEKVVMDACNLCIGLDISKDHPIIEGWPISKVAVFLVNRAKEKCLLQFCCITQGVWSLVEKDLEECDENGSLQTKSEYALKQLAFSAVEQKTGIGCSDLKILERHLTYSLSHEKTSARLYIMEYGRTLSEELPELAIKDVIKSLEGPIVKKDETCEVTPVVEYYDVLPYIDIISSWITRDSTRNNLLDLPGQQVDKEEQCSSVLDEAPSLKDHEVKLQMDLNEAEVDIQNSKPIITETIETKRNELSLMNGSSGAASTLENTLHNTLDLQWQQVVNEEKCGLVLEEIPPRKDHETETELVSNEAKVETENRKLIESKTVEMKRNEGNGSLRAANGVENFRHSSGDLQKQKVLNKDKCSFVPNQVLPKKDHEARTKLVSNEPKVEDTHNSKSIQSETVVMNRNMTNGPSGAANKLENTRHNSSDLQEQKVANEEKCSLVLNETRSMKDNKPTKLVLNEQNVDSKLIRSETTDTNRNAMSAMNRPSGAASTLENRNVQDKNIPNSKKSTLKDAITYNRRVGSSGATNYCKLVDSKQHLVPKSRGIGKSCGLNEQSGNAKSNIMIKTESGNIKNNMNELPSNNGSACAPNRVQNMADVSRMVFDGHVALKDQATNDMSVQRGKTKDSVNSKTNNIKDSSRSDEISGLFCMNVMPTTVNSCKDDSSPLTHHQQSSCCEDANGRNVISDAHINKGNNYIHRKIPASIGVFEDQVGTVSSDKQVDFALGDQPLVPIQLRSNDHSTFYHMMASKKNDLLQASLRVLQKKRDELYHQKHSLEDEISRCELNIQTILRDGEESPVLTVESILEALNCYCSNQSQVQVYVNQHSGEQSPSQTIKRRKLSEAVLISKNSCQELDDICHKNSWILPRYIVLPSFADFQNTGMFKATVTIQGTDFECSSCGDLKSSPHEARDSAATHMLTKLRMQQAGSNAD